MKKVLFSLSFILTLSCVKAQISPTLSKSQANSYIQNKYPGAPSEGESNLFSIDKVTGDVKVANDDDPAGKIRVLETTWWVGIDGGGYCYGVTIFYVHIVMGVQVCAGHWATAGLCN